jgi:general secretion pathway protein K
MAVAAHSGRDSESGVALLLVIWVTALLAALAAAATLEVRAGLDVTRGLVESTRSRTLADSGIWVAVAALLDERTYASLRRDGTPQVLPAAGEAITVEIEDERAKFDINSVREAPLAKLFQIVGLDASLARNLVVYRGDRKPAFTALEELRLVPGFTAERFAKVAPFLTVLTDDWRIHPATARPEVLLALPDVDAPLVQRYLALRRELASDDVALRLASPPAIANQAVWGEPRFLTIRSTARLETGALFSRQAVVDLDPEGRRPYRVLEWVQKRVD